MNIPNDEIMKMMSKLALEQATTALAAQARDFARHLPQDVTGEQLTNSIKQQNPHQTLLGVTGSGKTFTVANIIQNTQLPTLVMCHNKTLAFFPVCYFY